MTYFNYRNSVKQQKGNANFARNCIKGFFISFIVDPLNVVKNPSFWMYKILHCKEQKFAGPIFFHLLFTNPWTPNLGSTQLRRVQYPQISNRKIWLLNIHKKHFSRSTLIFCAARYNLKWLSYSCKLNMMD